MSEAAVSMVDERVAARRGTQTAKKVLTILRIVVAEPEGLTLAEIAARSGQNKSTAYRLVRFLEDERLVVKDPVSGRYTTGAGLVSLAAGALAQMNIRRLARPVLERLAEATTETVLMYVRSEHSRVCIDGIEGRHTVRRGIQIGRVVPIYRGPTGAVMISCLPEAEQEEVIAEADAAGEDVDKLRTVLRRIRKDGYAGEYSVSLGAFAVPVRLADGGVAAITISGPADRCTKKTMAPFVPLALAEAARLSEASP